ncbi:hypothetical protein RRF57_008889 [Xylaria bambusicola]|uniref:Uncharacterized protein n=1 Tax=Xylaria bambusicola TaxID=326684 RepID=A0AAN7UIN4_9PEZI
MTFSSNTAHVNRTPTPPVWDEDLSLAWYDCWLDATILAVSAERFPRLAQGSPISAQGFRAQPSGQ